MAALCYEAFKAIKTTAVCRTELVVNPVAKYVIEHLVYHLCNVQEQSLTVNLCNIVTDLHYIYYKLLLSQSSVKKYH